MKTEKVSICRRTVMMLTGILFISLCVGCYRLSNFGVDAFTCMNLGISGFLHMSFGTWQLIMNAVILLAVYVTVRKNIGAGTILDSESARIAILSGADYLLENESRDSPPRFLIHKAISPEPPTCHRGRFSDGSRAPFAAVVAPAAPGRISKGYPANSAGVPLLPRLPKPPI